MKKYTAGLIAAVASAAVGFCVHVGTQGWVQAWVTSHMEGREVAASWDVRYLALLTSLETGIGLVVLYALIRRALPGHWPILRGLLLAVLLLAAMGRLIRQPVMNLAIGNPFSVVSVQDGVTWLVWSLMCVVVAVAYDYLAPQNAP